MNAMLNKFTEELAAKMEAAVSRVAAVVEEVINQEDLIEFMRVKEADEHLQEGDEAYRQVLLNLLIIQSVRRMAQGLKLNEADPQAEDKLALTFQQMLHDVTKFASTLR